MDTTDFRNGLAIMFKNEPHTIVEFQHVNPGKGAAFVRSKLKSLKSGKVIEYTFKAGESVEGANVQNLKCQFLYEQSGEYFFMITDTYEQYTLSVDQLGGSTDYLKEGQEGMLTLLDGNPVDLQLPNKINFNVTDAPPGVKGDTATGDTKDVTIETGAQISTPLFIKTGDTIRVNTQTGAYDSRVN